MEPSFLLTEGDNVGFGGGSAGIDFQAVVGWAERIMGSPQSSCEEMLRMMILENQRLRQGLEMLRGHGEGQQASVKDLVSLFEGGSKTSGSMATSRRFVLVSWTRNRLPSL